MSTFVKVISNDHRPWNVGDILLVSDECKGNFRRVEKIISYSNQTTENYQRDGFDIRNYIPNRFIVNDDVCIPYYIKTSEEQKARKQIELEKHIKEIFKKQRYYTELLSWGRYTENKLERVLFESQPVLVEELFAEAASQSGVIGSGVGPGTIYYGLPPSWTSHTL